MSGVVNGGSHGRKPKGASDDLHSEMHDGRPSGMKSNDMEGGKASHDGMRATAPLELSARAIYRWLIGVVGARGAWSVAGLTLVQGLTAGNAVMFALYMKDAIDYAVARNTAAFTRAAVVFGVALLVQVLLVGFGRWLRESAQSTMDNRIRQYGFGGMLAGDVSTLRQWHSGELMNRLTSDVSVVSGGVVSLIPSAVAIGIRIAGVLIVMTMLDWRLSVLFLAAGCLMGLASFALRGWLKRLHRGVQEAEGRMRSFMQEALENLLVIHVFHAADRILARNAENLMAHRAARMRRVRATNISSTGLLAAMQIGYFIGFTWCAVGILRGEMSYGTLMAVVQLVGQIQQPFASLGGMFPQHAAMLASVERLIEVGEPNRDADANPPRCMALRAADVYAALSTIEFSHVDFTYGRNQVLRDFSMRVRRGEFVAVTGRSGIGKSTMLELMLGVLSPQRGEIRLRLRNDAEMVKPRAGSASAGGLGTAVDIDQASENGRNGCSDERVLAPCDLPAGLFAYVPQGNALMSGTIREAVAFADAPEAIDDKRVRWACGIADASSFIEMQPEGYATELGEHGAGLSEGQMQRLAVARALYSGAPIMLLDEATSALDVATEHHMLAAIRDLRDRTVFIVTHRDEVLEYCDRVVRLGVNADDGKA